MSQTKTYEIRCPRCQHAMQVELYESVNVGTQPELRDLLLQNKINHVECEQCQLSFRVDKPFLYSDPARRLLIYLIPVNEKDYEAGQDQFAEWVREMGSVLPEGVEAPAVHLVFSRMELIERVFMLEEGLDERLVEYIKYLIFSKNTERIPPQDKSILFNAQDSTPEELCFVVLDLKTKQFDAVLKYNRAAYQALNEAFGKEEKTADLLEMFPGPYISARQTLLHEIEDGIPQEAPESTDAEPDDPKPPTLPY